ncbi:shikimate dehydrogenase [Pelotalea chapellei]|uniref:Shikimate dehydrogenase (NADP(+)) n=1 Tax=Pelotalea chapellei TaxID=44671 RepID=A0ABS5U7F1_9BACT|nr:shikimate dehydrogenase [Pelotalea chapellei]MBT1071589.1 shikimate dehydrogenase [Pelotalea chapellei]
MQILNGKTRVLGIIGHPVEHSLSPLLQNAALDASDLNYVYVPFNVHPDELGCAVAGLRSLGVAGFNVTIPHKTAVINHLDRLDKSAELAGAVNVVHNDSGRLIGYNTDGAGLLKSLEEDLAFVPGDDRIIIIGAGGAARGAVAALCSGGASSIVVVNRSQDRALELTRSLWSHFPQVDFTVVSTAYELMPFLRDCVLVLNTTSLGMHNETIPFLKISALPPTAKVYDMVYTPAITPFLHEAMAKGHTCANGSGMLVGQGEYAFKIWTGKIPPPGLMKSLFPCSYSI